MNWDELVVTVKKTVGKTADKINQTADLATLQVKLSRLEYRLDEAYKELGKVAYTHFSDVENNTSAIAAAMEKVEKAQKNVDNMKKQIDEVKKKN